MGEQATSSSSAMDTSGPVEGLVDGPDPSLPPAVLVLGMAGSGKTSFVQRLTAHLHALKTPPYVVNMDPAVSEVPYPANVDIRDTVKYKEVQTQYGLGPNGAIMTSLNLFATRFDQVVSIVRRRGTDPGYPLAIFDTPGQIEAFTWSASGQIITDALASSQPTVVAYVVDAARATNPTTFMSNMLYACSILYRTKLPFIVVFNKSDIVRPDELQRWLRDFEAWEEAINDGASTYLTDLSRSLSLVLDEFYRDLKTVAVSALTGEGLDEFIKAVKDSVEIYKAEYLPAYRKALADRQAKAAAEKVKDMEEARKDVEVLSMEPHTDPVFGRIHLGGVDEENDEDANIARPRPA